MIFSFLFATLPFSLPYNFTVTERMEAVKKTDQQILSLPYPLRMTYLTLVEDEEGKAERRIDRLGKNMKFTYPKAGVIEYYIYGKKSRSYDKYTAVDLKKEENEQKLKDRDSFDPYNSWLCEVDFVDYSKEDHDSSPGVIFSFPFMEFPAEGFEPLPFSSPGLWEYRFLGEERWGEKTVRLYRASRLVSFKEIYMKPVKYTPRPGKVVPMNEVEIEEKQARLEKTLYVDKSTGWPLKVVDLGPEGSPAIETTFSGWKEDGVGKTDFFFPQGYNEGFETHGFLYFLGIKDLEDLKDLQFSSEGSLKESQDLGLGAFLEELRKYVFNDRPDAPRLYGWDANAFYRWHRYIYNLEYEEHLMDRLSLLPFGAAGIWRNDYDLTEHHPPYPPQLDYSFMVLFGDYDYGNFPYYNKEKIRRYILAKREAGKAGQGYKSPPPR
ncbi:hypothetical protein [Candidatus Methylacidiphilum infernorum]|uniref:Uncharacterized protein n=1 Tax=Methylacidiphilum infernorum (isolate V4) TaxID=481448 RepID=B3E0V6_METI4|nr:hypothetical protein [Candidatus Methylacidiphilum infernorum]ACD84433.1 Hypothetical protein Minf_2379 [Methylacidiphilum infernorum V4]